MLAELTRQGFRLDACEGTIGVEPASKLTDSLRQAIRENIGKLLELLKPATKARIRRPRSRKPRDAGPSKWAAALVQQISGKSNPADQLSKLCPRCRGIGHAMCRECTLRSEPGLVLGRDGVIYRVSPAPQPVIKGWHRCEECNEPYQGVFPPFGTAKVCPKCTKPSKR